MTVIDIPRENETLDDAIALIEETYRCSIEAGRRPLQVWANNNEGRYYRYRYTEQTIRKQETHNLELIHVFSPEEVAKIGRRTLFESPADRVQELDDGAVLFVTTDISGDDEDLRDDIEEVERHLGLGGPVGTDWYSDIDHELDYVRFRAANHLRDNAEDVSLERIIEKLDSPYPPIRWLMAGILTRGEYVHPGRPLDASGDPAEQTVPPLLDLLEHDDDERVRAYVADQLGSFVWDMDVPWGGLKEEIRDGLRQALHDDSRRVRMNALDSLRKPTKTQTKKRVIELLHSEDGLERSDTADLILENRLEWAYEELASMTDDSWGSIDEKALEAKKRLAPDGSLEHLIVRGRIWIKHKLG